MTALLLHGLVPDGARPPQDAPDHQRVGAAGLIALATPAPARLLEDSAEPPLDEVLRHHRLLSAYAACADVLPVRFGTAFSTLAALRQALSEGGRGFARDLARLAGCVEYALTVTSAPGRPGDPASPAATAAPADGRSFLATKRKVRDDLRTRSARRAAFVRALPEAIAAEIADIRQNAPARREILADVALLVPRTAEADLIARLQDLGRQATPLGLSLALRGPTPCYAFAAPPDAAKEPEDTLTDA